jgi:hypothetical protein
VRAATVLAVGLVLSCLGCGSNDAASTTPSTAASPGSLQALWQRPGEDVGLVFGTNDYAPGPVRVSFLVVTHRARSVERPTARVWLSRGLNQKPFRSGTARLEDIGGGQKIYVTKLDVPSAGTYWLLAEPVGGTTKIQGVGNVVVQKDSRSPALGDDAFPSKNPTLDDAPAEQITTARPPDTELLRTSIKDAVDRHEPFVVVFATPKYCQSRTCGPVVGIVERVGERFASTPVRFIHVEVYEGNNPALGENRWFKEWKLQSEPWVFLVGRDGKIKARFEGPVSERELGDAVSEFLT